MDRPQFTQEEADTAYTRLTKRLRDEQQRLRDEQIRQQPKPDTEHMVETDEIWAYGHAEPLMTLWCCDWHRVHAEDDGLRSARQGMVRMFYLFEFFDRDAPDGLEWVVGGYFKTREAAERHMEKLIDAQMREDLAKRTRWHDEAMQRHLEDKALVKAGLRDRVSHPLPGEIRKPERSEVARDFRITEQEFEDD